MKKRLAILFLVFAAIFVHAAEDERPVVDASKVPVEKIANTNLPTLHLVGDSTVRGSSSGSAIVGWGERLAPFFDTNKINVVNNAIAGRSARTYDVEGRWAKVSSTLKPGDFVIIQFGHNDQGRIGDPANKHRADGYGIGPETADDTLVDGTKEAVHTFGWYMAQFVTDAHAHGAIVIICSPIPHKQHWENGRDFTDIAQWDSQVAKNNDALFLDLTMVITDNYRKMGMEKVAPLFADKGTHTTDAGAQLNAACVVAGLKSLNTNPLAPFFSIKGEEIPAYIPLAQNASTNSASAQP